MRGLFVGIVGAVALVAAVSGLALGSFRAGPFDRPLGPVEVLGQAEGTYQSRGAGEAPLGVCLQPPCTAVTAIDLRVRGLPLVPYGVSLQVGSAGGDAVDLGTVEPADGVLAIRWSEARDHTDKDRIVLQVAGRDVASLAVRPSTQPIDLSGPVRAHWPTPAATRTVHVNEVGGITLSTIATARLPDAPPEGWEFRARFVGPAGIVDLGALEPRGDDLVLDGRVERLRLEDQDAVVVVVAPQDSEDEAGFPVLHADLWP